MIVESESFFKTSKLKQILVLLFGKKRIGTDISPNGTTQVIAYEFMDKLYVFSIKQKEVKISDEC